MINTAKIERAIVNANPATLALIFDDLDDVRAFACAVLDARKTEHLTKGFLRRYNVAFRRRQRPRNTTKMLCACPIRSKRFSELGRFYFITQRDGVVDHHVDLVIDKRTRHQWAEWIREHGDAA